uniref:Essential protein Yae1 N-terminal domain-containing protein n=1 Tax=Phocoena sinus TaxID=42100 RepID=A0A8C9DZV1_PHOSS
VSVDFACQDRFHGEGYQEGYEEGSSLGMIEGRQYGTLHGARIGSEIRCYQGFAFAWRCLLHGYATEKAKR